MRAVDGSIAASILQMTFSKVVGSPLQFIFRVCKGGLGEDKAQRCATLLA